MDNHSCFELLSSVGIKSGFPLESLAEFTGLSRILRSFLFHCEKDLDL